MTDPKHPDLVDLLRRSRLSDQAVREEWDARTDVQKTWKASDAVWSMAQCLDHLASTVNAYARVVEPALERAEAVARAQGETWDPIKLSWFGGWFIKVTGPGGRSLKSPSIFKPADVPAGVDVIEPFEASQQTVQRWIQRAEGLPLNGPKFSSPVTFLVRFTLGEALTLMVAHTERHVTQAIRTRTLPGFPA